MFRTLQAQSATLHPLAALDWVSLFAMAVNEENRGRQSRRHRSDQRRRRDHPGGAGLPPALRA